MTAEQRELFRVSLLQQLAAAAGVGLPLARLRIGAVHAGFADATLDAINAELLYLLDKGFVVATEKTISPEIKRWRITAAGRDFLAEQGLA